MYECALCLAPFSTEVDRASHFAAAHPISDPDELEALLRVYRRDHTPPTRQEA